MNPWQRIVSVTSVTTGMVGALLIGGVTIQRRAVRRYRADADGPTGAQPYDALVADRSYSVVASDGVVLHVEEVGPEDAALTVVFSHGWLLRIGAWHYQRLALAGDRPDLRLVFHDQRSHGRSGRAGPGHSTLTDLGDDLGAVIDTAAPTGRLVLIGHSMGGMSVLALARRRPDLFAGRVVGVGLLATAARGGAGLTLGRLLSTATGPVVRLVSGTAGRYPALVERGRAGTREAGWLLARSFGFARKDVGIELVDYLDQMISAVPVDVIAEFTPAFLRLNETASLPVLADLPVAIVVGDADRITPVSSSAALALALPNAELTVVPGAGHMVTMEAPAELTAALDRLLDRAARWSP